jgi:hypothetical protein
MLNYKHRAGSKRQIRIVDTGLEATYSVLVQGEKSLSIDPLPEPDDIPEDERTETFLAALGQAKTADLEYLVKLEGLDAVARQDENSLAELERWLRDRVRDLLGLPPRQNRQQLNLNEHARKHGIDPSYELPENSTEKKNPCLRTLYFADELEARLARITADARLAEQETGLSTLFLAFGFLRWYESNGSEVSNFAPLLLLPVEIHKRIEHRRAVYKLKAAAEAAEINLSLRELLKRNSPDFPRVLWILTMKRTTWGATSRKSAMPSPA